MSKQGSFTWPRVLREAALTRRSSSAAPPLDSSATAGYEKSRSLNNISGMTGAPLRLTPITPINNTSYEPYESPGPLRRCRSPIPSIL
ncbi:hypothetical protein DNTS_001248 [Danionella cerebrum]|uniref:Uncharacterized protein n=1 Tax=Danionella cerebrum TaxID=2873325 RepID=A0A553R9X5_9TELE|nr:hypothetical protein DNTS_001248 [Danionella translucida]